jgi:hypothetical protein
MQMEQCFCRLAEESSERVVEAGAEAPEQAGQAEQAIRARPISTATAEKQDRAAEAQAASLI